MEHTNTHTHVPTRSRAQCNQSTQQQPGGDSEGEHLADHGGMARCKSGVRTLIHTHTNRFFFVFI